MNVETTIALPQELLHAVDERCDVYGGRSQLIEAAIRALLDRLAPGPLESHDAVLIERHLEQLNAEAEDALDYQVPL